MKLFRTHKTRATVVGPLRYCMYGPDHSKDQLSRGHVVPRGLGGGIVILKSSCEECRIKTCAIEDACLRVNWQLFRVQNNLDMSDPKNVPTHGDIAVENEGKQRIQSVPLTQCPNILTMPLPETPPAIVTGDCTPGSVRLGHFYEPTDLASKEILHPGFLGVTGLFNAMAVFQLLAKIAHGMMFVNFDVSNIRPLLPPMIVDGATEDWWQLIGVGPDLGAPPLEPQWWGAHQIQIAGGLHNNGKYYVLVDIRLFANIVGARLPTPTYRIVAGECDVAPSPSEWYFHKKRSGYF